MTTTELRRRVLEKLQVLASGEPVNASDGQLVRGAYERLHEILLDDDLVSFVASDDIPTDYAGPLVSLVAAELVDEFHCPDGLKAKILIEGKYGSSPMSFAERQLRKLSAPGFSGETAESEYF